MSSSLTIQAFRMGSVDFVVRDVDFLPASIRIPAKRYRRLTRPPEVDSQDWKKRRTLFSKFDDGIRMDPESWFEVTPENVAIYIASRVASKDIVIDGCCGIGGNSLQFAKAVRRVIAVDSSERRIEMAKRNASIYKVHSGIEFVCEDVVAFLSGMSKLERACFYISPPWGGKTCYEAELMSIDDLPIRLSPVMNLALEKMGSVILHLPRNTDLRDLADKVYACGLNYFEVDAVYYTHPTRHLKFYIVYIDKCSAYPDSLFSKARDTARASISPFLGSGRVQQILALSYLNLTYLGRFVSEALRRDGQEGVSLLPLTQTFIDS